jgi:hypothetical protein
VTPKAPLTGSGCREHSYGGFGGGHPHFHAHTDCQQRDLIALSLEIGQIAAGEAAEQNTHPGRAMFLRPEVGMVRDC